MNLRRLAIFLCIVIAIIAWSLLSPGNPGPIANAAPPAESANISPGETAPDGKQPALSKVAWKSTRAFETGDVPKVTLADCERFLAKHGETPANLLAVFDQTGDRKWLERALATFPDSPIVLFSALTESPDAPPEQLAAWLEKFKTVDPNNPVPWLIAANSLFKQDRPAEAMEQASAALDRPAFYTYSTERSAAAQALYEESGLHPLEAELLGTMTLKLPLLGVAMGISKGLQLLKAPETAEASTIADAGRIQYNLGRMFQTPEASRLIIGQLVGVALETKGLTSRPPDFQTMRTAQLEAQKAEIKTLTQAVQITDSSDEKQVAEYLRRLRTEGELSALRWLKAQQK